MNKRSLNGVTITIIAPKDLSKIQGSTETYYVTRELGRKHEVHLFAYSDPEIENVHYHQLKSGLGPALIGVNLLQLPLFIKHLKRTGTDILYTYRGLHIGAWLAARVAGCKWVTDFQTPPTDQDREFSEISGQISATGKLYLALQDACYRATLPDAHGVIALSDGIADQLVNKYNVRMEKVSIVPLGVDLERYNPSIYDQEPPSSPLNGVYLGSIAEFRGLDTMFEALALRKDLQNEIQLHIIGDGPEYTVQALQKRTEDLGVREMVTWHGYINHEKIPEHLAKMDFAVSPLPALKSYEVSSPAKIFEYLAMGLPVICSDIEAHRKVLTPGVTGFFYPPGKAFGLGKAIVEIIEYITRHGDSVRAEVRDHSKAYGWEAHVEKIEANFL